MGPPPDPKQGRNARHGRNLKSRISGSIRRERIEFTWTKRNSSRLDRFGTFVSDYAGGGIRAGRNIPMTMQDWGPAS